ncbi:uncharacterized protein [Aegilops tauschii subsp. strangulata]|uniref:DUF4220 domain-containing protein n=2 Tax=Aegilops tauschii TaxID=37682 RepID=A0A453AEL8_AEGTS|nr:uncharacterized protein LOC109773943 [Aegilops tauschii subsp. strangulata]
MDLKNTTTNTTLVQRLGSNEVRLLRVELLVLFSTLAWILLERFGSFRRRYSHGFFRLLIWTVYTLSTVLAPYTVGLLQAGPFRDQTFVLWGTILLLIQVHSDSLSVYSIQDIEQRKKMLAQQVLQIFLVLWLIINGSGGNKSYRATIWIVYILSIIQAFRKFRHLSKASKKGGLVEHSKVIADHMVSEHQLDQGIINPTTMEGYSYIFHGEMKLASLLPAAPEYRVELKEVTSVKYITIDSVWRWIESRGFEHKETAEGYKDIALSFTLFKLLKRRFCGYRLGEAGLEKTLHLVLHGLLSGDEGSYVRTFQVIEEELSFLYDFFYTRMESVAHTFFLSITAISTIIVWNSISGAFSRHYHHTNLEHRFFGADVIRGITILLLANLVLIYLMKIFVRPRRFGIVWKLCLEVPNDTPTNPQTKTETWSPTAGETWERKLGQYSLLLNFDYDPWNALSFLSLGLIEATRKGQKAGEKIKLADTVIVHVLSQFKNNNGKLENGQSATNQLGSQFSWACTLPTHIHTILVWHIATTISWNEVPLEGNLDRLVAVSLSDYCAYLVAFVPDMLPGHGYDTRCTFDAVVLEAQQCLAECETVSNRCEKLVRGLGGMGGTGTILYMGAKLGRQLRDMVPDQEQRWKVLADFWAEFILFLAPSDNTEIHGEKLSAGGEFMTHLWALLTHAGILERPSSSSGINAPTAQDSAV